MLVFKTLEDVKKHGFKNARLTIGRFQGVHLGHQSLMSRLGESQEGSPRVVLTFDPPPEDVLRGRSHLQMMTMPQKIRAFRDLGMDAVFFIPFTLELAQLPAKEFAREYILSPFSPQLIVVGYDFAFGRNREGNVSVLGSMVDASTKLIQIAVLKKNDEVISTSSIRRKILEGDVHTAKELLGRPFEVEGVVVHGEKRGRGLGFPTLNLDYAPLQLLPHLGVYAVGVSIEGEDYYGVCNVGFNPTFSQDQRMKVECHILDFDRDIYDQPVKLSFLKRIREEKRFQSKEELVQQVQQDIVTAKSFFSSLPNG